MAKRPEFEFVKAQSCRDPQVSNCPEVATNIPGVVAIRDSKTPDHVLALSVEDWTTLTDAVKAGEYDLTI
ncbi:MULTISPECIES: DUF397 domain-containing protein [Streptomyces]|uniref:DUF397 domain-containing protein n=1 Tax=Streptomyces viridochromogenes TaxID=1938 RepID=A0A0L8J071_STRVR|nr:MULTISPECIES: DUF397 domain-containing protein [Streptomyces]KOG07066.1 hypothetical protein ADK34_40850 [Streptomyces viridochromogenes]